MVVAMEVSTDCNKQEEGKLGPEHSGPEHSGPECSGV